MRGAFVGVTVMLLGFVSAGSAFQGAEQTEANVREVLERYSTALESLDAEAVKRVQPSINVEGLRKAFAEMKTLDVEIDTVKVLSSEAAMTRVSCRVTQTLTPKTGSRKSTAVTRVMRLRRVESGWVIDTFER